MGNLVSRSELLDALNLLDDYLSGGFRRDRPALAEGEQDSLDVVPEAPSGAVPEAPSGVSSDDLEAVAKEAAACTLCGLHAGRTRVVAGEGPRDAVLMLVGEAPGEEEDRTGRPFVGASGQYLDQWLQSIELQRGSCYIANCLKCRPPQNRDPQAEELEACRPLLDRQIRALAPRAILCLGRVAAQALLHSKATIGELRSRQHAMGGIPVFVTYHPSAVLRDPALRRPVWEDLKKLKAFLGQG